MLKKPMNPRILAPLLFALTGVALDAGMQITDSTAVTAELRPLQDLVTVGQPVWVDFVLHNPTSEVAVLYQQGAERLDLNPPEMGLPIEHVFGRSLDAVAIYDESGRPVGSVDLPPAPSHSTALRLSPSSSIGVRIDLARFFPGLLQAGTYEIRWRPYEASTPTITHIEVVALKQARIETDFGNLTIRLFYEAAPLHVYNFVELASDGFYDALTFHRLVPRFLIQGGAPGEAAAALRPDGKVLPPEFNDHKFDRGTIGMARRPSDPNSASCQFFICASRWPELDGQYTAFGELIGDDSFVTLERIMDVPVDENNAPREKIYIRAVRIENTSTDRTRTTGSFSEQ